MKKLFFLGSVCVLLTACADAQTWSEWFRQKATQKKYLLQQIAALQVYIEYAAKGYEIAGKGIATIRHIKNGDFDLHRDFFGYLKNVSPAVSRYAKVADIITYQIQIVRQTKKSLQSLVSNNQFTPSEIEYCKKVLQNLLDACGKTLDDLTTVVVSDKLTMTDAERLNRIDRIYSEMQDTFSFCKSFSNGLNILAAQRRSQAVELDYSKILNGLK